MHENIKSWLGNEQVFTAILLVTVGVGSFWLGQQSVGGVPQSAPAEVVVEFGAFAPTNTEALISSGQLPLLAAQETRPVVSSRVTDDYVASRAGARYHHYTCPGAKQIKEENKIYFATPAEAEAAGYTRAANCQR